MAVLMLTLCWCYKVGEWVKQQQSIVLKIHQCPAAQLLRLGLHTLRRLVSSATFHAAELRRMLQLVFDKNKAYIAGYGGLKGATDAIYTHPDRSLFVLTGEYSQTFECYLAMGKPKYWHTSLRQDNSVLLTRQ